MCSNGGVGCGVGSIGAGNGVSGEGGGGGGGEGGDDSDEIVARGPQGICMRYLRGWYWWWWWWEWHQCSLVDNRLIGMQSDTVFWFNIGE